MWVNGISSAATLLSNVRDTHIHTLDTPATNSIALLSCCTFPFINNRVVFAPFWLYLPYLGLPTVRGTHITATCTPSISTPGCRAIIWNSARIAQLYAGHRDTDTHSRQGTPVLHSSHLKLMHWCCRTCVWYYHTTACVCVVYLREFVFADSNTSEQYCQLITSWLYGRFWKHVRFKCLFIIHEMKPNKRI